MACHIDLRGEDQPRHRKAAKGFGGSRMAPLTITRLLNQGQTSPNSAFPSQTADFLRHEIFY